MGGTLFEIGGYLMILESLNRKHEVTNPKVPEFLLIGRSALAMPFIMLGPIARMIFTIVHVASRMIPKRAPAKKTTSNNGGGLAPDGEK